MIKIFQMEMVKGVELPYLMILTYIHAVTQFAGPISRFEAYVDIRGERFERLKKKCKHFVRLWI
jgi:hypothetical protein